MNELNYRLTIHGNGVAICMEENFVNDLFYTYQAALNEPRFTSAELVNNYTGEVLAYFNYSEQGGAIESHTYLCPALNALW